MGNSVNLTFSHFSMEEHYGTGNCSFDYLEVRQLGPAGGVTQLGRWCGDTLPPAISSSADTVLVHFQSDYSVAHNGFRLGGKAESKVKLCSFKQRFPKIPQSFSIVS